MIEGKAQLEATSAINENVSQPYNLKRHVLSNKILINMNCRMFTNKTRIIKSITVKIKRKNELR